jgi:hypothetical protein
MNAPNIQRAIQAQTVRRGAKRSRGFGNAKPEKRAFMRVSEEIDAQPANP